MTGGRIKLVARYLDKDEPFCMTYGDGVGDIDIAKLLGVSSRPWIEGHRNRNHCAGPIRRAADEGDVGRGLPGEACGRRRVDQRRLFRIIAGSAGLDRWRVDCLGARAYGTVSHSVQLAAYKHSGFWQPMDTLREKNQLEALWESGKAPWQVWE